MPPASVCGLARIVLGTPLKGLFLVGLRTPIHRVRRPDLLLARSLCLIGWSAVPFLLSHLAFAQALPPPAGEIRSADSTSSGPSHIAGVDLRTLPQTIGIEHQDRINRFRRLARLKDMQAPEIEDMAVPAGRVPGFDYPIPVVRIRFPERVFFDFDKAAVRPEAAAILDLIAESMRRDLPDVKITILGHTDAIGSDAYNFALSSRRAQSVMQALFERGVGLFQMSTVAVGKTQPVAPNSTPEGRALNRRVEFMISASDKANLLLVSRRRVVCEYLAVAQTATKSARCTLQVGAPRRLSIQKPVTAHAAGPSTGSIHLQAAGTVEIEKPESIVEIRRVAPIPDVKITPPEAVHQAKLRQEFDL